MDEPTNHLDMRSKDILKSALRDYNGTLLVVSHDREFLDGLVDKVYEFRNHRIYEHLGGIYEFLKRRKLDSLRELERAGKSLQQEPVPPAENIDNKALYQQRREKDKVIRKVAGQLEKTENEITMLEKTLEEMNRQLTSPEGVSNAGLFAGYEEVKRKLDARMMRWEDLHHELEKLKDERF